MSIFYFFALINNLHHNVQKLWMVRGELDDKTIVQDLNSFMVNSLSWNRKVTDILTHNLVHLFKTCTENLKNKIKTHWPAWFEKGDEWSRGLLHFKSLHSPSIYTKKGQAVFWRHTLLLLLACFPLRKSVSLLPIFHHYILFEPSSKFTTTKKIFPPLFSDFIKSLPTLKCRRILK